MSSRVIFPQLMSMECAFNCILSPLFLAHFMSDEIITLNV